MRFNELIYEEKQVGRSAPCFFSKNKQIERKLDKKGKIYYNM